MIFRLLTATLFASALVACGDKADAPADTAPETPAVTEAPETTPAPVQQPAGPNFKPSDFVTNSTGLPVKISDRILVESDAVILRVNKQFPTLGLSETYPVLDGQDYVVEVDVSAENVVGNIGFRVVAWPLNADGKPVDQTTYKAIGSKFDEAAGRQTLRFRFGPATGETKAANRLPDVEADAIRFLLVPVSNSEGTIVSVYDMRVQAE